MKKEIKQNLYRRNPAKYNDNPERLEYEAELELRRLAGKGNEEAIRELSKRVF